MGKKTRILLCGIAIVIVAGFLVVLPIILDTKVLEKYANWAQIIQAVVSVVLVSGALLVYLQLNESIKARDLDGIRYVKNLIGTEEAGKARNSLRKYLDPKLPLSDDDAEKARQICRDFDHIGYLCRKHLISETLVTETYNSNIIEMWNLLKRFVVHWREQMHDADRYGEFELLAIKAEEARNRMEKHSPFPWITAKNKS